MLSVAFEFSKGVIHLDLCECEPKKPKLNKYYEERMFILRISAS